MESSIDDLPNELPCHLTGRSWQCEIPVRITITEQKGWVQNVEVEVPDGNASGWVCARFRLKGTVKQVARRAAVAVSVAVRTLTKQTYGGRKEVSDAVRELCGFLDPE